MGADQLKFIAHRSLLVEASPFPMQMFRPGQKSSSDRAYLEHVDAGVFELFYQSPFRRLPFATAKAA